MRVMHTLTETPRSRKTNTLLRARHTHTLRERNINKENKNTLIH